MTPSLSLPVAVVTGASRGLGRGIAEALALARHQVVLVARDEDDLARAAGAIGARATAMATDVTDEDAVARLADRVHAERGAVRLLVNAAGAPPVVEPPDRLTWEGWRTPIDVDVRGVFAMVRAFAPLLADGATVVNVGSGAASIGSALHTSYSPGQAALLSLSRCLGAWLAPRGVTTHCLHPRLSLHGSIGRTAATAFGALDGLTAEEWMRQRHGPDPLTPAGAGAAVVSLLDEPDGQDWLLEPTGLVAWEPLAPPRSVA
jgi:NAD(P)-dependent dehydrogenase (short-subunit alcohol dehydrogenase family)